MKILGMETAVGPKPSGLTPRIFTEFNQVFLEIYGELEHKKVVEYQTQNYESKGILKHGDFTLGKVRNWLAYHQLLAVAKLKEPDKNDKTKMRTVYQLGPTKLGKQTYQEGAIIEVDAWKKGLKLGIGKMYPDYEDLWKMCLAKAEADGVAKSRRENWYGPFRDDVFIAKLAAMTNDNAKAEALKWVLGMIAESPRKGHRSIRSIKRYNAVAAEGEIFLGQQQSLMDFVKKRKPKPEKPKPKPCPEPTLRVIPTEAKEDSAYIHIMAQLSPYRDAQSRLENKEDATFIPYFTRNDSISLVGRLGSSGGSGGAWYNAKHIALSVRHFICGALDMGVKPKNIKVVWEKNDLIFLHPPYWNIVKYSRNPADLSNCKTFEEYVKKLAYCVERLSEYLTNKGVLAVLLGDVRKNGCYYPLGAYVQVLFRKELKAKLIKIQHGVLSDRQFWKLYGNTIRIMHEEVLVLSSFSQITWRGLIRRVFDELNADQLTLPEIYKLLEKHPKRLTNLTFKATIRRTLQESAVNISKGVWTICR
jgi:hypothetical protein